MAPVQLPKRRLVPPEYHLGERPVRVMRDGLGGCVHPFLSRCGTPVWLYEARAAHCLSGSPNWHAACRVCYASKRTYALPEARLSLRKKPNEHAPKAKPPEQ